MHKMLFLLCAAAGCAMSDVELSDEELALTGYSVEQWTDGAWVSDQRSNYQVGLASYGGRLHMLYRTDNTSLIRPELKWSRFDGSSWSAPELQPHLEADYGPSMTVHDGKLVVAYNSYNENRILMSTSTGQAWSTPVTAGTSLIRSTVKYAPSIVNYRNMLYLAYCKADVVSNKVQIDRFNGFEWTSAATFDVPFPLTCKSVTIAALPGPTFHVVWNVNFEGDWFLYEASGSGVSNDLLTPRFVTGQNSAKPASIVHCDGLTHFVHGGVANPEAIYWSFRENGQWTPDVRVPEQQSYGGAQLGCFGTRTIMVHNTENTSRLVWHEFGP